MVCFVLLSCHGMRHLYLTMQEDALAVFYSTFAIYLLLRKRVFLATLVFSVAFSIKTNILLLLPAFLVIIR